MYEKCKHKITFSSELVILYKFIPLYGAHRSDCMDTACPAPPHAVTSSQDCIIIIHEIEGLDEEVSIFRRTYILSTPKLT